MAGIQDFVTQAAQKLGLPAAVAGAGTGGLLGLAQQHLGAADFGRLAAALPGAGELVQSAGGGGGGLGAALGGLAGKAGGLLGGGGGAAGALGALAAAGLPAAKAGPFLEMLVGFLKQKLPADLLKTLASKVPGLGALAG
jgi:hypothetical protein